MFETSFFPWLSGQSTLSTLIGQRCFPGHAPDAVVRPYIVFYLTTADSEHTHSGPAFRSQRIQFSIFADTLAVAGQIRDVLLDLLDGKRLTIAGLVEVTCFLESVSHQYENSTKLHHMAADVTVSYSV